ncbi:glycosyltransferase family 2 protein [Candidatus Aerophobetes bacterium]|uniref:Glycosyltransferase family 2 protein n=1 Tax=Aerophobetes bacterium TaxID=2030807 RepID=A0A523TH17_UNCAE|nr:MAG: glycosyltransferase family 2 protein [Candidatus Aerophobetes bacterium]
MNKMEVSIIIPTYNRKEILREALEFLFNQSYPKENYEIVIVDDGSTDGTEKMINSLSPPCRLVYLHQDRKGPAIARNLGIKNARGKIIVFIDSDIFSSPDFINEHVKFHRRFGDVVVSGPTVRTDKLKDVFSDIKRRKFRESLAWSGPSLITSNLSVKKEFLLKVGGFDGEFVGMGWHDWELGLRLKKLGLEVKRNVEAIVYHYKRKRRLSDIPFLCEKRRGQGINAVLYYKKHPSLKVKLGIRPQSLIFDKLIGWIDKNFGERLILLAARKGDQWWLNLLIKWKLLHAYAQGLRDGMKKYKVRLF